MYYVYILCNNAGVRYIGVTNDLKRRVYERIQRSLEGFTKKYDIDRLISFEETTDVTEDIPREKTLKRWNRSWKTKLINDTDPKWIDLYDQL